MSERTTRENFDGKFPTAKEIRSINDLDELQKIFDDLTVDVSHLETRLEFLPDEDLDREKGIRNALAFGRSALKAVEAHRKRLKAGEAGPDVAAIAKSREARVLAAAEQSKAAAAIVQMRLEKAKESLRFQEAQIRTKMLKSVSWHVCFVRAARGTLPPDVLAKIEEAADDDYLQRLQEEAKPHIRSDE
jgi:hypothetical protein